MHKITFDDEPIFPINSIELSSFQLDKEPVKIISDLKVENEVLRCTENTHSESK